MAAWRGLHLDLLALILKKINCIEDFTAFGMVCKSWHVAATNNKQYLRCPPTPWLMLPARECEAEQHIFSLSKQHWLTKNLYIPEMSNKECVGLNYGWVITIVRNDQDMNLVHPLSRFQIHLPPSPDNLPTSSYLNNAALSANPSESPSDFVLMIVYGSFEMILAYWRPGDKRWTNAGAAPWFNDLIYHHNEDLFYVITQSGAVWSWEDLGPCQDPIFARVVSTMDWRSTRKPTATCEKELYVVAGSAPGSVFVVVCFLDEIEFTKESFETRTHKGFWQVEHLKKWFRVYELDLINGEEGEIKSLGDRAIFLGSSTSMVLENASEYRGIKPNHIYFTSDSLYRWEKDVGCYNLEDGQTTHIRVDVALGRPFWFMPFL